MTLFICEFWFEYECEDTVVVEAVSEQHAVELARERTVSDDYADCIVKPLPAMVAA